MILLLPLTTESITLFFWVPALGDRRLFSICRRIPMAERLRLSAQKKTQ